MTAIVPMKTSSSEEMLELFKEYKERVENELGWRIKRFRSDGGGEYEKGFGKYLKKCGIRKEITAPYSPDQNGVSERANRTIIERTKAIMADMDIPKHLWFKVAKSVVYLKNRSPTKSVPTTPYEAWHHQKPNLSHLRIIGTTCYVHIPKQKRIKLDDNAHSAIFLGYAGTNQYQVWDLIREDIVASRDVVFDESWRSWKQCWESCVTVRPHDTGPGPILVSRSCSDCNLMFKSRIRVVSILTTFKVGLGSVDNQKVHG